MHVAQLSFFVDASRRAPKELLDVWYGSTAIAEAVASVGTSVSVILASMIPGRIERSGVVYEFVVPEQAGRRVTQGRGFERLLKQLAPDVLHVHGLGFPAETLDLNDRFTGVPVLLQDHANRPPRIWQRRLWRRAIQTVSGVSFCARAQAEPFRAAGLLRQDMPIFEIPESTSAFMPGDQSAARAKTGMFGEPAVLVVAHLNDNKDPQTVLDGVSAAVASLPGLQLWWCFASAPRLSAVQSRIQHDTRLRDRVHLLGKVPHADIEELMRAADLFVLGSHREGGSFSLIEALATGLTPVVTDIPSNRAFTGNGRVGALWTKGDSDSLAKALVTSAAKLQPNSRQNVLAHFREHLSSAAVGRRFTQAYRQLIASETPRQVRPSRQS